ncbi:SOUL family heme-binding protein [Tessaracoccus antarcticus]|uniref:Heme-binding protein n=1 Tax=Tessaracoccus antarcticus TaxID=2479848 RepID=A0A3M0G7T2_9ACTN|nr:heme-binding protein [Tessaracoccus antarcticus]RMB60187.1 heme-binding protein [Tessaracoccus antarcticus]
MTEQQKYDVVAGHDGWEVRRYPAHLVAEVTVHGSFDDAVNRAFRMLAAFIFGDNVGKQKVAMTAPVVQKPSPEKIAMTAPVLHESSGQEHVVSFVMPAEYTMDTLPEPTDVNVRIREVAEDMAAVRQFSGRSTEAKFAEQLAGLMVRIGEQSTLEVTGSPRYARFDPPWKPWFLRRNEVLIPVATAGD